MNTLYKTLLGTEFNALSPLLQRFHTGQNKVWRGEAQVNWSTSQLLRLFLKLGSLPKESAKLPVTVCITNNKNGEIWHRNFGGKAMRSRQKLHGKTLCESFGPVSLALTNQIQQGSLYQTCSRSRILGVPLPHPFAFRIAAREWQTGERFNFDVEISLAKLSLIRYRGWLVPNSQEA